jgi:archaellum component FlaF (FlaF/FlaG flagellin family)
MKASFKMFVVIAIAFATSLCASAQSRIIEVDSIRVSEAKMYGDILRKNNTDTLRATTTTSDTSYVYSCFLRDGKMVFKTDKTPIVRDTVVVKTYDVKALGALDTARVERHFFRQLKEDRGVDQTFYVYTDENGQVRTIPKKDISKDGLHIGPRGGYVWGEGYQGVSGFLSIGFYQPKWWIETSAGYGYSKYSSVAVDYANQSYNCYKLEAVAGWTPVQVKADKFDQHRVSLFAGVGFNWYQTMSQMSEDMGLQSKGWTPYPTAGAEYKFRPFQSGLYVALRYQLGADIQVVQNSPVEVDLWHQISLGLQVNLTRHGGRK